MADLSNLRGAVREILDHALRAVDAREAVMRAIRANRAKLILVDARPIYVLALGKAAFPTTLGLIEAVGDKIHAGVITCPAETVTRVLPPSRWQVFAGGHPLPNEASLDAASAAFALVNRAVRERALVVFLVSGGGSAMMEWPRNAAITLSDLREANRVLVQCGASITEINAVRRAFSSVKGGGLAARAEGADIVTLIVSDTAVGDDASVASGPTLLPPVDSPDPVQIVEQFHLVDCLPETILQTVKQYNRDSSDTVSGPHYVLLNNSTALEAAAVKAAAIGFVTTVRNDISDQSIEEGCELLLSDLDALEMSPRGICLISGGEFSCPVRSSGVGGRNLETVLRCAMELPKRKAAGQDTLVLSAGTDGIDGSSVAAGAIADESTMERAMSQGLDPKSFLENSDSYGFFAGLNDTIITGPTGTNVRDLRVLLRTINSNK